MKRGRYGNVKKPIEDDIRFDSMRELNRYREHKLELKAGVIRDLEVHPKFPITIMGVEIRIYSKRYHKTGRHLVYEADFGYFDVEKNEKIIEDVKMGSGHRTEIYKIKRALMKAMGYEITEY